MRGWGWGTLRPPHSSLSFPSCWSVLITATPTSGFDGPRSPLKLWLGSLEPGVIMEEVSVGGGVRALAAERPLVHLH